MFFRCCPLPSWIRSKIKRFNKNSRLPCQSHCHKQNCPHHHHRQKMINSRSKSNSWRRIWMREVKGVYIFHHNLLTDYPFSTFLLPIDSWDSKLFVALIVFSKKVFLTQIWTVKTPNEKSWAWETPGRVQRAATTGVRVTRADKEGEQCNENRNRHT